MYPVANAGILLWRRGCFVVLVCEEGVWLPWCNTKHRLHCNFKYIQSLFYALDAFPKK
jgi:hypothetical protein